MESAQRVLHGMVGAVAAQRHRNTGEGAAVGDLLAGSDVPAIGAGPCEVPSDGGDDLAGEEIAQRRGLLRQVAFDAMEERIEALEGGQPRREGGHQLRIDHG